MQKEFQLTKFHTMHCKCKIGRKEKQRLTKITLDRQYK